MRKKLLCAILASVMALSFTACGGNGDKGNSNGESATQTATEAKPAIESSAALLNSVWEKVDEANKFPVMGGDFDNMVDGEAGIASITNVENLTATLHITEDSVALVDEVGTLIHAMNTNTFTAAAYHLKDSANAETLANSLKDSISTTQWMCGFPDTLIIYTVNDEYVVAAFGNKDAIASFKTNLEAVYAENATLNVEEALV
ncbi:MAG: hypothetical protein UD936_03500 [Acutalibacteraceae bacterium]|nr:hypothetical protein [Acutalibacteraceae bacterium]